MWIHVGKIPPRLLSSSVNYSTSASRHLSTTLGPDPLRFCIVGSGPAGFYTADKLLKKYGDRAQVDLLDALPTPFGLVRSGVAPDHADTKNVINQFTQLGHDERVEFLGNVRLGRDVSVEELRKLYSAVVLCYGAESDRKLEIPGEDLEGVFSAREFVWWYNGHPQYAQLPVDLSRVRRVAICGLGNVAVDCARVLLQPANTLATTDIASHAVEQLRRSCVERVHLIGRRGPVQAAFTPKELRELLGIQGVGVALDPPAFEVSPADEAEMKATRMKKRIFDLLAKQLQEGRQGARTLSIDFLRSPAEVLGDELGQVRGVRLERMRLEAGENGSGSQRAVGTGEFETIEADLVLKSIGFKSVGVPGVAFDARRGVIPNTLGQVLREDGSPDPGLFVCGWLKRGPSGIIGTNLVDAEQTVATMAEREGEFRGAATPGRRGLMELLGSRGTQVVTFQDWLKIDREEVERGQARGKPREKLVDVQELLSVAGG